MENHVEITPTNHNHKKKLVVIGIAILVLIVAALIAYQYTQNNKELQLKEQYSSDLNDLVYDIISISADAESMINIYIKMWEGVVSSPLDINMISSIFKIPSDELIGFLKENNLQYKFSDGQVVAKGDINHAIYVTNVYFENANKIKMLENGKSDASIKIRELNNPPNEYEKAYEVAFQIYNLYDQHISLAIEPDGSILSFSEKTSQLSSDIVKASKEFQARMPLE